MDSVALFAEKAFATEEVREWLSMFVKHDCLTGTDVLYNALMLGAVNDVDDLAASDMDVGAVCSKSAVAYADSDGRELPHISKTDDPPISYTDVERSQYHSV